MTNEPTRAREESKRHALAGTLATPTIGGVCLLLSAALSPGIPACGAQPDDGEPGPIGAPLSPAAIIEDVGDWARPKCQGIPATIWVGMPTRLVPKGATVKANACGGAKIVGTDGPDVIVGSAGADHIFGGNGDDVICAKESGDTVEGGNGADMIYGACGPDVLVGGPGDDSINGGGGRDRIDGGRGNDLLSGGPGPDQIFGGSGDDVLQGGPSPDCLDPGTGIDVLDPEGGPATCGQAGSGGHEDDGGCSGGHQDGG